MNFPDGLLEIAYAVRRVGERPPAMRYIVKAFRRPPTGRIRDPKGGLPRLSDVVAHALRCPASPQRALLAENLGRPSLWVIISDLWYKSPTLHVRGAETGLRRARGFSSMGRCTKAAARPKATPAHHMGAYEPVAS